jgi:hypothetical protein
MTTNLFKSGLFLVGVYFCLLTSIVVSATPSARYSTTEDSTTSFLPFLQHLFQLKNYPEAIRYIDLKRQSGKLAPAQFDSLNYYSGYCYFKLEKFDTASIYWAKNSKNTQEPILLNTHFHLASIYFKQQRIALVKRELNFLHQASLMEQEQELLLLYDAALAVFENKSGLYDSLMLLSNKNNYLMQTEIKDIQKVSAKLLHAKKKKGLIAAGMSAIIPGSGKFYSGYFGSPFGALIASGLLAGVAYENFHKSGYKSPNFIASAGLFAIFYSGNVIGSLYSVKIKSNENKKYYKGILLYNLYTALERVYPE